MESFSGLVPLVVGVTGHRDICLRHESLLRTAIADALRFLRGDYRIPIVVLSGLARGADRIVAEVALAEGHGLIAALPMPIPDYEEESRKLGEDQASLDNFHGLLGRALNSYVVPSAHGDGDERYAALGREIARSSHIVLSLWDSGDEEAEGGTGWVVKERLGRHRGGSIPGGPPTGAVYQIVIHRELQCPADFRNYQTKWLVPERRVAGDLNLEDFKRHVCSYIQAFNDDAQDVSDVTGPGIEECYVIADSLAIKFRRRTDLAWLSIYLLVFGAATSFAVFAHSENHELIYVFGYASLLVAAISVHGWARHSNFQNKGQDYRALSEGLRIASAWRLLGISDSVSECYLSRQADETRWIRYALGAIERASRPRPPVPQQEAVARTVRHWIRPEWDYYVGALRWVHSVAEHCERLSKWTALLSIVLTLLLVVGRALPVTTIGGFAAEHFDLLSILTTMSAVAAALSHSFIEKRAWKEHIRRYTRMSRLLEDTVERLDPLGGAPATSPAQAVGLLRAVAQEELDENGAWLQAHRDRPLEIPHAG